MIDRKNFSISRPSQIQQQKIKAKKQQKNKNDSKTGLEQSNIENNLQNQQQQQQVLSPVEERALSIVFDILCTAESYYQDEDFSNKQSENNENEDLKQEKGLLSVNQKGQARQNNSSRQSNQRNVKKNPSSTETKSFMLSKNKPITEPHFTWVQLGIAMNYLGYYPHKDVIREMIWDVDETNRGAVTKQQFIDSYKRVRFDKTNLEPRNFYNVVQYLMFLYNSPANRQDDYGLEKKDKDNKKEITFENTLEILYVIYGKDNIEQYTTLIFGKEGDGSDYNPLINEKSIKMEGYVKIMKNFDVKCRKEFYQEKKSRYEHGYKDEGVEVLDQY